MRIIAGKWRGKRLIAPKNLPVRPTTDMAKESLFNILQNYFDLDQIHFLDLFTGTGNISYEMASRGVTTITCVDQNNHCIQYIHRITQDLGITLQIVRADVFNFIQKNRTSYDLIFADPPYDLPFEKYEILIKAIFEKKIIQKEGLFVLEHATSLSFTEYPNFLMQKKYGSVCFSFFEYPIHKS